MPQLNGSPSLSAGGHHAVRRFPGFGRAITRKMAVLTEQTLMVVLIATVATSSAKK
jgi:hypothetical protein